MKNLKLVAAAFLCFFLFSNSSCEKEKDNKDTLPPETHEGLNTIGFLFNNELFRENGIWGYGSKQNPDTKLINNGFSINAKHAGTFGNQIISFGVPHFNGVGKYITGAYFLNTKYNVAAYGDDYCRYLTDTLNNNGYVNITYYDPIKKIVSGTFSFNVRLTFSSPETNTCDSIIDITEGRFDLKYYQ